MKNCKDFLADECKVKVILYYPKGKRRLLQMDSATKILDKIVEALADISIVESTVMNGDKKSGVVLGPKKTK